MTGRWVRLAAVREQGSPRWGKPAGAAVLGMVAPMLMHAYTDATAAGQALIATEFATVLLVVWVPSGNS